MSGTQLLRGIGLLHDTCLICVAQESAIPNYKSIEL